MSDDKLPQQIMELLRERSNRNNEYINPHFLSEIAGLLESYYHLEDDDVHDWISNIWSR